MDEFNDRMSAQRALLRVVNAIEICKEELFGLSSHAIDRWVVANRLDDNGQLVKLVRRAAETLFFLATKSQEQVSERYRANERAVAEIISELRVEASKVDADADLFFRTMQRKAGMC